MIICQEIKEELLKQGVDMKNAVFAFGLIAGLMTTNALADEATEKIVKKFVVSCQKHCKKAKTPEKIHKCIEKKGRLNKSFRNTTCWEVNEIYEKIDKKKRMKDQKDIKS